MRPEPQRRNNPVGRGSREEAYPGGTAPLVRSCVRPVVLFHFAAASFINSLPHAFLDLHRRVHLPRKLDRARQVSVTAEAAWCAGVGR